jgi:putative ABC transport system permease protein
MRMLDRKLVRDLRQMWAQALAIALVIASGVATFVLASGAYHSLEETRSAYYLRYRFADVFAEVRRAAKSIADRISTIPGVAAVEPRITQLALLDVRGLAEPATGRAVSVPEFTEPRLNLLHLREGRLPERERVNEVTINEAFANAHNMHVGATFKALLNGKKHELRVVGIALSPEFIYALGPGDVMPDDRRFAVLWMSERALAALLDLDGAFNSISLRLLPGTSQPEAIKQVDDLLARYGGTGALARKDQLSHAFLDAELQATRRAATSDAADFSARFRFPYQYHAIAHDRARTRTNRAFKGSGVRSAAHCGALYQSGARRNGGRHRHRLFGWRLVGQGADAPLRRLFPLPVPDLPP